MAYALIRDGVVVHKIEIGKPRPGMVEVPPEVQCGWLINERGAFEEPPPPPPPPEPKPTAEDIRAASFKSDAGRAALLDKMASATPAQIDAYVDANVTTLAQARTMFKGVLKMMALEVRG